MSAKRLREGYLFDRAVRKATQGAALSEQEVELVLRRLFDGRWISLFAFRQIQQSLSRAAAPSRTVSDSIRRFQSLGYDEYLRRRDDLRRLASIDVPCTVDHIPKTTPHSRRPGLSMTARYLTIHSTGNPSSSTGGERAWLTNPQNDRQASFHLVVDERRAVECIPVDEVAWHAGDGNGDGNRKSISLEICESGDRAVTLRNAIALAAKLLRDNNLETSALRRHHDWASKMCPRILIVPESRARPDQTWEWFTNEVDRIA